MITAADVRFHKPTSDHFTWAETNYFGFYNPDVPIYVLVYVLARQNLGTVMSSVNVFDGFCNTPHEVLYSDNHVHLPFPKGDMDDYQLENGLSIRCTKQPGMDYALRYNADNGVRFEVTYTGLMAPYDIHDPKMDPLAAAEVHGDSVSAQAYAGHWDQSGRVRGWLEVYGKRHEIDCVASMDHSWGLRGERQLKNFCWLNANFEDDSSYHCIWLVDPKRLDHLPQLLHGYVREGQQVHGLVKGHGTVRRDGFQQRYLSLEVEDVRGKRHAFTGSPVTSNVWLAWPLMYVGHTLCRWNRSGVMGWGEVQDLCKDDFNGKLSK